MPASLDDLPELLEVPLVAEYLGVSQESVRRMLRDGRLIGVFLGRSWKVPKDELRAFIERRKGVRPPRKGGPAPTDAESHPTPLAGGRVHPGSAPADDDDDEPGAIAAGGGGGRRSYSFGPTGERRYHLVG